MLISTTGSGSAERFGRKVDPLKFGHTTKRRPSFSEDY